MTQEASLRIAAATGSDDAVGGEFDPIRLGVTGKTVRHGDEALVAAERGDLARTGVVDTENAEEVATRVPGVTEVIEELTVQSV